MDRYEEALKKAKMYHRNAKAAGDYADVARYENIFPELRESEEETIRKELLDFVRSFWADHKEKLPQASRWVTYLEKQKEPENVSASTMAPACWEVELKKQEVGHLHPEDYPMTPEECIKPTEWSEEDEEMRKIIIAVLQVNHPHDFFKANDPGDGNIRVVPVEELVAWLKSLRPSWKPSEEQMEALLWCTAHLGGADRRVLAELYEHLKKPI